MLVPASALAASLATIRRHFDVYPLWICPMRIFPEDAGFVHPTRAGEQMFVDVGIYGVPKSKTFVAKESTRAVEDFVREAEGFQMLYADMYQTRDEFRAMVHALHAAGIDCVAMCVNDILCVGAEPIIFLDYVSVGVLDPDVVATLVELGQQRRDHEVGGICRQHVGAFTGHAHAQRPGATLGLNAQPKRQRNGEAVVAGPEVRGRAGNVDDCGGLGHGQEPSGSVGGAPLFHTRCDLDRAVHFRAVCH
jgi:hypothetical protein